MLQLLSFILSIIMVILSAFGCDSELLSGSYYTDDVSAYGDYTEPAALPDFFPTSLDGLDVESYGYRDYSSFFDTSFEIFLVVKISDAEKFDSLIKKAIDDPDMKVHTTAFYDEKYTEIVFADDYFIYEYEEGDEEPLVGSANIEKVIYCEETGTIIYESFHVGEAGVYYVDEVMYFNYFSIDEYDYSDTSTIPDI